MTKPYDVIVAGAGPVGLFTACELAMKGVSVLVLERDAEPESPWKTKPLGLRGLNTTSAEHFYRRGLLDQVLERKVEAHETFLKKEGFQFAGHFAGLMLNANKLDLTRWKYRLPGPALVPGGTYLSRIEAVLAERAESFGATILRGAGVTGVSQDDASVTVEAGENQTYTAKWLVGCDGGRSRVRRAAGFDFVGTEPEFTGHILSAELDPPDKLNKGFTITQGGMYMSVMGNILYLLDFDGGRFQRSQTITVEHANQVLERVTGFTDVKIAKIHHASSFTDRSMQTTSYRRGRVFLAGDAAHIHSPLGAQGLNLGLGDAMNLGWKLAAAVQHRAPKKTAEADADALLDTYEKERHPIGAWCMDWTRAQVSALRPGPHGAATRQLLADLIDTVDGSNFFIGRIWGLSQRYDLGDQQQQHPLVGCSAPDFELSDETRLSNKMEGARGVLVDFGHHEDEKSEVRELLLADDAHTGRRYEGKVDYLGVGAKDQLGLRAILVRPDGIVAWVAEEKEKPDLDAARAALERWFGLGL